MSNSLISHACSSPTSPASSKTRTKTKARNHFKAHRTLSVILFVIDISGFEGRDPRDDFKVLRNELNEYNPELLDRPFLVALNKIDQEGAEENLKNFYQDYPFDKATLFPISAMNAQGLEPLKDAMRKLVPFPSQRTCSNKRHRSRRT